MTDIKEYIADSAKNIVNGARRGAYGKPENNFERIATMWMAYFHTKGWSIAEVDASADNFGQLRSFDNKLLPRDIAAMMRLMKEARLVETPDHLDSFMDIVGYALCGAEVAGVQVPEEKAAVDQKALIGRVMQETSKIYEERLLKKDKEIAYLRHHLENMTTGSQNASVGQGVASSQAVVPEPGTGPNTSP